MNDLFELCFFGDLPDAVKRVWCCDLKQARDYAEKEFRLHHPEFYTATVWGKNVFLCIYLNDLGEVFIKQEPFVLSRRQAGDLRRH
jgi:hypothetical protein